jgi:hypothetical protein
MQSPDLGNGTYWVIALEKSSHNGQRRITKVGLISARNGYPAMRENHRPTDRDSHASQRGS